MPNSPPPSPTLPPDLPLLIRLDAELTRMEPDIIRFRRHLHRHPELSLHEFATSEYIAAQLEAEGISSVFGSGKRGLIVDLGDADSHYRIGLRADCDALPIQEENDFPHASGNPGVMHACGHDAHTAMLLGALIALHRAGAGVAVRGIFQPAEEAGDGAAGMIADGALQGITGIIALHVDPNLPTGQAAAVAGPQSASCQDFTIGIIGRGGHAARPHLAIDPVAVAASLITQIYQTVPRHLDSRRAVVVSICRIHAGHATNVIPDTAHLSGTIRALDDQSSIHAEETVTRICTGLGKVHGARIIPVFDRRIPGVVNDPDITATCAGAAQRLFGYDSVRITGEASLGAEDFADYLQQVPGCMMRLGTKYADRAVTPLHTPTFDIDEAALLPGSRLLLHALLKLSSSHVDSNRL